MAFSSLDSSSDKLTIKVYLLLQLVKVFNLVFDKGLRIKVLLVWEITLPSSWIKFNWEKLASSIKVSALCFLV